MVRIPVARLLFVGLAVLALSGCSGKGDPTAVGTVASVQEAGDPLVFIMDAPGTSLDGAVITVVSGDLSGATSAEVVAGDAVKVWADVCAQSYPPQCTATSVEVGGS
jgi:hypothetical protein